MVNLRLFLKYLKLLRQDPPERDIFHRLIALVCTTAPLWLCHKHFKRLNVLRGVVWSHYHAMVTMVVVQHHLERSDQTARNSWRQPPRALRQPQNHHNMQETRETFHQSTVLYYTWEMMVCSSGDWTAIAEIWPHIVHFDHPRRKIGRILAWICLYYFQSRHGRHFTGIPKRREFNGS